MIYEKSCGGLVFRCRGGRIQMLLIRHKKGGRWSFPKGHVEAGETERQTALREIREETGLKVRLLRGYRECVCYNPRPDVRKQVVYFLAVSDWVEPVPQEEEIRAAVWMDLDRIPHRMRYWNDKRLVAKAIKRIKSEQKSGLLLDKRKKS